MHACGVVIAAEPLDTLVPLRRDRRDGRDGTWVTQFDGADITAVGLLKLDVLAIKNLDMVKHAVRLIALRTGETVDPEQLPTDPGDPRVKATWELIKNGRTAGLFQLASPGMTALARRVGPDNLDDLSVLVALFRPGPLGERMHDRFAERRAGREPVDYGIFTDDPAEQAVLAGVLGETLGSIVYQEQMMRLGTVMAGFTPAQSSRLRKAVSKKNPTEMTAVGALFAAGCAAEVRDDTGAVVKTAFAAATATRVWDAMKHAAAFAFNKSHSYAYGTLAYVTAFLKANWPVEYGAALLTVATRDDKRQQAFDDLADDGIDVLPASVNDSDTASTAVDGGAIRLGLAEVKGVGAAAAEAVVGERRRGGQFTSLPDLLRRVTVPGDAGMQAPLPADAVDALIEAGACDAFGSRLGLLQIARAARDHPDLPVPTAEWGVLERAARERARTGATLSGHPLTGLGDRLREWRAPGTVDGAGRDLGMRPTPVHRIGGAGTVLTVGLVTDYTERGYSRGRMATFTLEGSRGRVRCVIWDRLLIDLRRRGQLPVEGRVAAVRGRVTTTRPVTDTGFDDNSFDGTGFDDTGFEISEPVAAQEIMVSNIFPVDVDEPGPGWFPPPGGRLTELWTARSPMYLTPAGPATPDVLGTGSAVPVASRPRTGSTRPAGARTGHRTAEARRRAGGPRRARRLRRPGSAGPAAAARGHHAAPRRRRLAGPGRPAGPVPGAHRQGSSAGDPRRTTRRQVRAGARRGRQRLLPGSSHHHTGRRPGTPHRDRRARQRDRTRRDRPGGGGTGARRTHQRHGETPAPGDRGAQRPGRPAADVHPPRAAPPPGTTAGSVTGRPGRARHLTRQPRRRGLTPTDPTPLRRDTRCRPTPTCCSPTWRPPGSTRRTTRSSRPRSCSPPPTSRSSPKPKCWCGPPPPHCTDCSPTTR